MIKYDIKYEYSRVNYVLRNLLMKLQYYTFKGPVCRIYGDVLAEYAWQKGNIIFISMFSFMYNHMTMRIIVFNYLRMSRLYLQRAWVVFHGGRHVALPCFLQ